MAGCQGEEWFERYETKDLSAQQAAQFESHLRQCQACAARQAARWKAEQALLADLKQIDPHSLDEAVPRAGAEADLSAPRGTRRLTNGQQLDAGVPGGGSSPPGLTDEGFEILHEVHRGGQGIVYQAIQKQTKRKVAVKVLLEGAHASPSAKRRFEREIELVAQLKHANIIAVFHAGSTTDGRQYCVMDYVHGRPLDRHAREKHLVLEDILKLFATICDAITYAHQRGIIHRDLKPSNILVDADGSPKILDFGLARQLAAPAETLASMTGQVFGTLPYMSPEQAGGNPAEVDTRSDVYALGVILYQLLTGHFPYPVEGLIPEVLRHISETPPTPPSRSWTIESGVAKRSARQAAPLECPIDDEVQTIVMKALVKGRERRYQSAADLARDIRHYLAGEPIEAKRDSSWYVLKKTIRRYKVPVALTAALFVLAVAGAIFLSIMYRAQTRLLAQVERERQQAIEARGEAEQQADTARTINEFLQAMLAAPDPFAEKPTAEVAREIKVVDVLDAAAAKIERSFASKPEIEGAVRTTLGTTYAGLGQVDKALAQFTRAVELRTRLLGAEHPDTLTSLVDMAFCLMKKGDFTGAERTHRQAAQARTRQLGPAHPDTLTSLNHVGLCLYYQKEYLSAEELLRPLVETCRKVLGDEHRTTQGGMNNLAMVLNARGRTSEAEALYRSLQEVRRRTLGEEHPDTIATQSNLAMLLRKTERWAEAEPLFSRAANSARHLLGEDHPLTLTITNNWALCLYEQGAYAEAEVLWQQVLASRRQALGDDHIDTLMTLNNLAAVAKVQGRLEEAERLHREALAGRRRTLGDSHPDTLMSLHHLARLFQEQGRLVEAETFFKETLPGASNCPNLEPQTLAVYRRNYGRCLLDMQHYADAEEMLLASYAGLAATFGPRHAYSQRVGVILVELYEAWAKPDQAAEWRAKLSMTTSAAAATSRPNSGNEGSRTDDDPARN